jgi:hypothetical protein
LIEVAVMISNGDDTNMFRDRALDVVRRLHHMFVHQMGVGLGITNWDYRLDPPGIVPAGTLATRSLSMVDRSEALLAIFGPTVPTITSEEVWRAFERRRSGEQAEVWTFLNPDQKTSDHDAFVERICSEFGEQVVWANYRDELDFQGRLFTTLLPYLLGRAGASFPGAAA